MKKIKILINRKKPQAQKMLRLAQQVAQDQGFVISAQPDFVVALGGDGTLLAAASIYGRKGTPILGVNMGGLGFLTDVTFENLQNTLHDIRTRKFRIEKRMLMRAKFDRLILDALNVWPKKGLSSVAGATSKRYSLKSNPLSPSRSVLK